MMENATNESIPLELRPNDVPWRIQADEPPTIEPKSISTGPHNTRFIWANNPEQQPLPHERPLREYFDLVFPHSILQPLIQLTNEAMDEDPHQVGSEFTEEEFFRYCGMRLMMTLIHLPHIDEYWKTERQEGDLINPLAFGREYGISKHRFELIERCLVWSKKEVKVCVFVIIIPN